MLQPLPIFEVLSTFMGILLNVNVATPINECQLSINRASTERQLSINNFRFCILYHPSDFRTYLSIIKVLPAFMENMSSVGAAIRQFGINSVSTKHQQFSVLLLISSMGCAMVFNHYGSIGCLYPLDHNSFRPKQATQTTTSPHLQK
jgi:hypothetical protein